MDKIYKVLLAGLFALSFSDASAMGIFGARTAATVGRNTITQITAPLRLPGTIRVHMGGHSFESPSTDNSAPLTKKDIAKRFTKELLTACKPFVAVAIGARFCPDNPTVFMECEMCFHMARHNMQAKFKNFIGKGDGGLS